MSFGFLSLFSSSSSLFVSVLLLLWEGSVDGWWIREDRALALLWRER